MYANMTEQWLYEFVEADEDMLPDRLIEVYKHSTDDPLTGLDDVLMEAWPFEAEDTEFFSEERPRDIPKPRHARRRIRPFATLGRLLRRRPERSAP